MQVTISTSPVSCCWAIAGTSPFASKRIAERIACRLASWVMGVILVSGDLAAKERLMGFSPRTETLLERAGTICEGRGARLTDLRRQVLGLILDAQGPTGAYDLLDRLKTTRIGAAPPTVYRALDFLLEQGLIHKLERLSAFVG